MLSIVAAVVVAVSAHAACHSATQIELAVTTDLPCATVASSGGADIFVAKDPDGLDAEEPRATAPGCADPSSATGGMLGTLVLVPRDERDATVTVEVVLRLPERATPCRPPEDVASCIVARRRVRFIEHRSLRMPINLDSRCRGVVCGPDQTCDRGLCFFIDVGDCPDGQCEVAGAPVTPPPAPAVTPDASSDAPADGGVDTDASDGATDIDAGVCPTLVPLQCPANCGAQRCCVASGGGFVCGDDCGTIGNDRVCTHDCQCGPQKCVRAPSCGNRFFCGGTCDPLE